jgi:hypothetical protein
MAAISHEPPTFLLTDWLTTDYCSSQSHIATDSQSVCLSWCRTPSEAYDQWLLLDWYPRYITSWHGSLRKHRFQQFLYCCVWTLCRRNLSVSPSLPSNGYRRYNNYLCRNWTLKHGLKSVERQTLYSSLVARLQNWYLLHLHYIQKCFKYRRADFKWTWYLLTCANIL